MRILLAINSAYALSNSFFLELKKINKFYPIDFLLIDDPANNSVNSLIKNLTLDFQNSNIIEISRIKNLSTLLKTFHSIYSIFFNVEYIVLIGSNINVEERLLIKALSKKSTFFGLMPTLPPIIRSFTSGNIVNLNKASKYRIVKIFDFNNVFNKLKHVPYKLCRILILYFFGYKSDLIALKNGYVNYQFVKGHFTINNYWAFLLKNEYKNEKIISFFDYPLVENQESLLKRKVINDKFRLLVLGPANENSFIAILNSINNLNKFFSICEISIRPHPSHLNISKKLQYFLIENKYSVDIVNFEILLYEQSFQFDVILGYASSALNALLGSNNIYYIIDQQYNEIEFGLPGVNPEKIIGSYYGFNKEYSILDSSGNWYCRFIPPTTLIDLRRNINFSEVFLNELYLIKKNDQYI
jgi:hypothetical protein